jgi:hypothetical protein
LKLGPIDPRLYKRSYLLVRNGAVDPSFARILWTGIFAIELPLVVVRMFMTPGPLRLSMSLAIPGLIILGAVTNAVYNLVTTGHALESPPRRASRR